MNEPLARAIEIIGSQSELARELSRRHNRVIRQGHIWTWLHRNKDGAPPEYAIDIEDMTGKQVSRHELSPKVFGPLPAEAAA